MSADYYGSIQSLKTEKFGQAEVDARNLAEQIGNLKSELDNCKNALLANWVGSGRSSFKSTYDVIARNINDISEEVWDLFDSLCNAEEAYIEADQGIATAITQSLEGDGGSSDGGGGAR